MHIFTIDLLKQIQRYKRFLYISAVKCTMYIVCVLRLRVITFCTFFFYHTFCHVTLCECRFIAVYFWIFCCFYSLFIYYYYYCCYTALKISQSKRTIKIYRCVFERLCTSSLSSNKQANKNSVE